MPEEIFPSSYLCDCGHKSSFFENTIREVKAESHRHEVWLYDDSEPEHIIVFYNGEMTDIICPLEEQEEPPSP